MKIHLIVLEIGAAQPVIHLHGIFGASYPFAFERKRSGHVRTYEVTDEASAKKFRTEVKDILNQVLTWPVIVDVELSGDEASNTSLLLADIDRLTERLKQAENTEAVEKRVIRAILGSIVGDLPDDADVPTLEELKQAADKQYEDFKAAKRIEKLCYDIHEALGVKFGQDPYAEIKRLKDLAAAKEGKEAHLNTVEENTEQSQQQDGAEAARRSHIPEVGGSNPSPAISSESAIRGQGEAATVPENLEEADKGVVLGTEKDPKVQPVRVQSPGGSPLPPLEGQGSSGESNGEQEQQSGGDSTGDSEVRSPVRELPRDRAQLSGEVKPKPAKGKGKKK